MAIFLQLWCYFPCDSYSNADKCGKLLKAFLQDCDFVSIDNSRLLADSYTYVSDRWCHVTLVRALACRVT